MKELKIPILEADRIKLEPLSLHHRDGMYTLWSDERVTKYSGKVSDYEGNEIIMPTRKMSDSDLIIDFWVKAAQEGWGFRWAVTLLNEKDSFAGIVGFNSVENDYEIAFHLSPKFWGKGIMTEASAKAIDWAQKRGANSITAFIEPENISSIKLAIRLGLKSTDEVSDGARKYLKMLI